MKKSKKKLVIILSVVTVVILAICVCGYFASMWVADKAISKVVDNLYDHNAVDENDDTNVIDISSLSQGEITAILVSGEIPQELIDQKKQQLEASQTTTPTPAPGTKPQATPKPDDTYYILTPAQARHIESQISSSDKLRLIQIAVDALPPSAYSEIYAILTEGGITASDMNKLYSVLDRYLNGKQKQEVLKLYSKYIYLLN